MALTAAEGHTLGVEPAFLRGTVAPGRRPFGQTTGVVKILLDEQLEARLCEHAARGVSVNEYLSSLVDAEERAISELERKLEEGLMSGPPFEPGPDYWREKHRRLGEQIRARGLN